MSSVPVMIQKVFTATSTFIDLYDKGEVGFGHLRWGIEQIKQFRDAASFAGGDNVLPRDKDMVVSVEDAAELMEVFRLTKAATKPKKP